MKNRTIWIGGILILSLGVLLFLSTLIRPASQTSVGNSTLTTLSSDEYIRGATSSPVTLIEYFDFECEACGAYYPLVKQLENDLGDRVTFVARYYPLPNHKNGLQAALAAEAAGRQGKFWEMHDLLFTRQKEWGEKQVETPEVFAQYAQEIGLDVERFKTDVTSAEVRARVQRDLDSGRALGVQGTPSFFLNGEKIQNPQSYEAFKTLLENKF